MRTLSFPAHPSLNLSFINIHTLHPYLNLLLPRSFINTHIHIPSLAPSLPFYKYASLTHSSHTRTHTRTHTRGSHTHIHEQQRHTHTHTHTHKARVGWWGCLRERVWRLV